MGQSMSILNPIDEIFLQPRSRTRQPSSSGGLSSLRSRLRSLLSSMFKDGRRNALTDDDHRRTPAPDNNDYERFGPFGSSYEEELARAVQESMDLDSQSRSRSAPSPSKQRYICAGCNQEIGPGRFLSCLGSVWHPQCFRCKACGDPISGSQFALSGSDRYHKECYRDLYHPKCEVCHQFIPPNSSGLIEYRAHPFWGQKYCPLHEKDSTPRCCSCERVEARDARFVSLDDGRKLCLECLDSAVMDTHECQHLYHEILDFYEGMNMKISQSIPMLLVERQALNEAREHERDGYHHLPETRGLCLSEEQTVSTVYRKPKASRSNPVGSMRKESLRLRRQCEVTAILVLYGLPRLLTGSILAHELMHAWLRLNGYPHQLNPAVEEGICQVMAHTWLESQIGSSGGSSSSSSGGKQKPKSINNDRFQEFFLHQIAMDSSPAYGDGFRAGHQSVVQFGLSRTLEHIKLTGSFPV
ncbi:protein DA1-related 1 isoform X2 [Selaginella moellendorffii]|uniref:protein DA1-related 1 isoform X2 n=1 Tax=Selaginella moellendorffii TaxID=88036 RepID=UPI000D1CFF39|nr:protein DA1-related 1 isoform X2 [Selaginella moellendorffii]|eukprot:XP_024521231.1 protein DA1-related 1 isoform X2 [Selaginella moellendorffii]